MTNSTDAKSTKCLSGIISRLLCTGSLPTHPSDQFIESNTKMINQKSLKADVEVKLAGSTPGIVARLMGLDSFPDSPLPYRDRTLGYYLRSRSVNSIDFLLHFDPIKKMDHRHRRVRTSVSFREGMDDNYGLVLDDFEKVYGTEELVIRKRGVKQLNMEKGVKSRKNEKLQERNVNNKPCKMGVGNARNQRKDFNGKTTNLKERRAIIKQMDCKEGFIGSSKCVKKKKKKKKVHSDDDQRGLRKLQFEKIQEVPRVKCSRKSLPSQIINAPILHSSSGAHCDEGEVRAIIKGKSERKMKNEERICCQRMVGEIYNLTKQDLQENWKLADFEETCQEFGQEILEVLLKQFVDELVLMYGTRE